LGDLFVFIFFGPVAVLGSAYLQSGSVPLLAGCAAVPVGLLVTNILVVNNLRDIDTDRAAGKRTLAVRIGRAGTRLQFTASALLAYLVPLVLGPLEGNFWLWLPLLTFPLGVGLVRTVQRAVDGPTLNEALKRSGRLHLLFGLLFAAGLWL
jgi:1,4-dihydroxy-2-naphthoate octaprenyltransferase